MITLAAFLIGTVLLPTANAQKTDTAEKNVIYEAALFEGLQYRYVGPSRGGRVTTVTGHPAHPYTFYMGAVGGGVWKTTNYGNTWRPITDGELTTGSIGALQVANSDTSVIYAGTGTDGIRSLIVTGRGVFKSTDAGENWELMGLEETGQIGAIEIHPENPDVAYAAALGHPFGTNEERGLFKTTDGGSTWEKVLFVSDSVGVIDVEMHPKNPEILYAGAWRGERKPWTIISGCAYPCGDGIWKSTDGGESWEQVLSGKDMPEGLIGKIDLGVSAANPDRVYALVEAKPPAEGLYRSDDQGETWELVNDRYDLMERPFYYTNVTGHPTNPNGVFVNAECCFFKSTDGGKTFEAIPTPHGDNHDMWINPENPQILIQSNDGGANVSLNGGKMWSTQLNQPTAELYQVDVDNQFPYRIYAGQQDEPAISVPSRPPSVRNAAVGPKAYWENMGCETGPAVPRPDNANIIFAPCKGKFARFSRIDGQEEKYYIGGEYLYGHNPADLKYRFQRTTPVEISPNDPDVVYHGSQYVHRTTNGGKTWERISPDLTANPEIGHRRSGEPITNDVTGEEYFSTTYRIQESPHNSDVIWVGTNDGLIQVTRNGGQNWSDVTPESLPKWGRINAIGISPHQAGKAYVSVYRFMLDDWEPYVYKTTDYGQSWTRITTGDNGIPSDIPVRVVREDPKRAGLLYAGTEFGMYVSFDDGAHWQLFQQNLPTTPITDIEVHRGDLVLSTMGRGFWIMYNLSPLRQLNWQVANSEAHLFRPAAQYRMRYNRPDQRNPANPQYPPPGVMIDYYLAKTPQGEVRLEILDEQDNMIRTFSSASDPARYEQRQGMREPQLVQVSSEQNLEKSAGMHRFIWNMEYPGPVVPDTLQQWGEEGTSYGGPTDDGPLAAPGTYHVRLLVGDDIVATRSFELMIDPRVQQDGTTVADLRAQHKLNLAIRDALSRAYLLAADVMQARKQVQDAGSGHSSLLASLTALKDSLLTKKEPVSYPEPMFIDQLQYLYGMTSGADQRLGDDAYDRYDELNGKLKTMEKKMGSVKGGGKFIVNTSSLRYRFCSRVDS